jgi:CheY-like chemotaxis protein
VELAKAVATSAVQLPVVLMSTESDSSRPPGVSHLPVLPKPLRESDIYDRLMDAFHLSEGGEDTQLERPRTRGEIRLRGHVLAVDDNEINQTVAEELLTALGLTVDVVGNGQLALEAVQQRRYDAVLMDCQMPVMDGYTAARAIRVWERETGRAHTPIVALTAHAFSGEREKVMSAGMDDYLTKPIPARLLETTLARWLAAPTVEQAHELPAAPVSRKITSLPAPMNDVGEVELDPQVPRSAKVMELFLRLVPVQIQELMASAKARDVAEVRAHSHKLKGSAASIGARAIASLCEAMQHAAEAGDVSEAEAQTALVQALFTRTARELERELERKRAAAG